MSDDPLSQLTKDDLEELLHTKVDSFTISPLTAPGENYGSTMLLVDATLLPDHRKISMAAKMVSEFPHMREIFNFRETMKKEIYMYKLVRPVFYAIQEEHKVPEAMFLDVIPKCYGARTTRGGDIDMPIEESAAILLENLKVSGYRLADRMVGLDLKHLEYVVTRLARFHATAIVIKLKKPDVFKDTVKRAAFFVKRGPPPGEEGLPSPLEIVDSLAELPAVSQYVDQIKKTVTKMFSLRNKSEPPKSREPFATLVHNDLWTNNMMFSYGGVNNENITGLKIFDFQMPTYDSPVIDLIFLLYASRSVDVTRKDCDKLMTLYHNEFTKWIELFGCDTEQFAYDKFLKEVEIEASQKFLQTFVMLKISSLPESNAPDLSTKTGIFRIFKDNSGLGQIYFKKVENFVKEFVDRKWI